MNYCVYNFNIPNKVLFKMGNSIGCIIQRYGPQLATIISLEKAETFL